MSEEMAGSDFTSHVQKCTQQEWTWTKRGNWTNRLKSIPVFINHLLPLKLVDFVIMTFCLCFQGFIKSSHLAHQILFLNFEFLQRSKLSTYMDKNIMHINT